MEGGELGSFKWDSLGLHLIHLGPLMCRQAALAGLASRLRWDASLKWFLLASIFITIFYPNALDLSKGGGHLSNRS